ncbi:MAG: 4-hydroxythreonine-4-phosphate dehydrogenase PdxA [Deferribacteres bacterium]|nr:4-hydroxythreonine-4-phosphate dehydrogenase PdxA [Deferribacteres bacterium]
MKNIAITMGDPGGIGPEVTAKALACAGMRDCCRPLVIGSAGVMEEAVRLAGLKLQVRPVGGPADPPAGAGVVEVLDMRGRLSSRRGVPSAGSGRAAVKYIKKAAALALKKQVHAIVTAPVSKESLRMAGYKWPGHTELLAELTNTEDFAMMFVSKRLKVILCTIHVPLKDVPGMINRRLVYRTIRLADTGARMLGVENRRIAVSGLNPHAGESGIMGREEDASIAPAVEKARKDGLEVSGPYPPDVVFHRAYKGDFDIIVCMYHDQGLIPFKMLYFDSGVNVTVGLPIIRTSPDHGTAFDIAWKNAANPSSMTEAVKLACRLRSLK